MFFYFKKRNNVSVSYLHNLFLTDIYTQSWTYIAVINNPLIHPFKVWLLVSRAIYSWQKKKHGVYKTLLMTRYYLALKVYIQVFSYRLKKRSM